MLAYMGRSDMDLVLISGNTSNIFSVSQGLLKKDFEKLDMYLNCLSEQREMVLDSPYFESRALVFEDPNELRGEETAQSSSLKIEEGDSAGITSEAITAKSEEKSLEGDTKEVSCSKQGLGMSRNYLFGALMLHLPRIAPLP
ncbi:hypothetical protein GOBAR_AA34426 [Gossypium barbadense]|uniref:Uncharacterized protein n=1 Tax=Gossypium barbadense TaxID=3634 RepID=A0A2P5W5A0_GOSBA|nr:hypothetical protein GOBAR_AA34426 [Gossypium barbadense]